MQNWYTENFLWGGQNQKKRDLFRGPLKKSYAGLRGVWIAERMLYAGSLLLVTSLKALLHNRSTNVSFEMA